MRELETAQSAYKVVDRLLSLRDLLREKPSTLKQISNHRPEHYTDDESGARKLRRDLQYLKRWGYEVKHDKAAKTYTLCVNQIEYGWADEELTALAALRECFKSRAPYADTLQCILGHIESGLNDQARKVFARKPALRIELAVAEERTPAAAVRRKLEEAIDKHQRVSFKYRPLDHPKVTEHPDDEPLTLEFEDGHYYLWAYCYKMDRVLQYRLDQIAQDSVQILPNRAVGGWRREMMNFQYRLSPKIAQRGVSQRFPEIVSYDVQKDGSVVVVARAYGEFQVVREILRYGEQAEILGPPALRARMKRVVEQMCALYGRDEGQTSGE